MIIIIIIVVIFILHYTRKNNYLVLHVKNSLYKSSFCMIGTYVQAQIWDSSNLVAANMYTDAARATLSTQTVGSFVFIFL